MMFAHNQSMMPYTQNYFGNQSIATPGFIANNFPTSSNAIPLDPGTRRKSIIENINPFISEQKVLPSDLLSAFPVSKKLHVKFVEEYNLITFKWEYYFVISGGSFTCSSIEVVS